ncbi:MAG: carbamoyltransferase HypF [Pseudonocardiales bacterium]
MSLATPPTLARPETSDERRVFRITGVVQGVGYRPFVHRLATELGLSGFVGNDALAVFAEVQGSPAALAEFNRRLPIEAPPLAVVVTIDAHPIAATTDCEVGFAVVASRGGAGAARTLVPPDVATCDGCLAELFDPADRRYRHPFITCTDCGPRFTIIQDLPYDRAATTMAGFAMCAACAREYESPADRRFHAQPVACPDCGPALWFERGPTRVDGADAALAAAQQALREGMIVAVKGVGGFHLACRADDPAAIARLRQRKARDEKPFALLARDLDAARRLARIEADEQAVLTCAARPIVLMQRRDDAAIAESVAPGNPLLGVMLPSSPLHHLLLAPVPGADLELLDVLVMTSANISDEPLCFDDVDATSRLPGLADAVLTHDRPIHVPCDDSVVRVLDGQELPLRRSRGYAPLPVRLGTGLPAALAVGAELKNTCCLIDGANAFCSAHIGDMGSLDTTRAFERAVDQLTTLHQVQPRVLAADAHPSYLTRSWAERHSGGPGEPELLLVQHHHAHVASLLAEHARIGQSVIGVAFDGTGYGDDGTIWGGEFLLLGDDTTRYRRAGHLMTVDLPGGDAAVRNPCRMALAFLDAAGVPWDDGLAPVDATSPAERAAVRAQLDSGVGTVKCSSMGRLFDAVASLLDVGHRVGYEAQAAIQLEVLAARGGPADAAPPLRFGLDQDGVLDYRPVVRALVGGMRAGVSPAHLAFAFHAAVTEAVANCVAQIADDSGVRMVGLTGGVFQNVLLLRACRDRLAADGVEVLVHRLVPPNDGGIALGQAVVAALRAMSAASRLGTGEKETP